MIEKGVCVEVQDKGEHTFLGLFGATMVKAKWVSERGRWARRLMNMEDAENGSPLMVGLIMRDGARLFVEQTLLGNGYSRWCWDCTVCKGKVLRRVRWWRKGNRRPRAVIEEEDYDYLLMAVLEYFAEHAAEGELRKGKK